MAAEDRRESRHAERSLVWRPRVAVDEGLDLWAVVDAHVVGYGVDVCVISLENQVVEAELEVGWAEADRMDVLHVLHTSVVVDVVESLSHVVKAIENAFVACVVDERRFVFFKLTTAEWQKAPGDAVFELEGDLVDAVVAADFGELITFHKITVYYPKVEPCCDGLWVLMISGRSGVGDVEQDGFWLSIRDCHH